jgi:hypothetical protein
MLRKLELFWQRRRVRVPAARIPVTLAAACCARQNTEFCSADASTANKKAQRR